ncbi:hypothetical protein [Rhodoligotrophos defluvii]|uniref:hypothetical protein n=1 Tax=Rhodoligotrophos defluvii TaxID=2561934 RepID=UPI0010C9C68C|nr:hypothetical protein [Rhodoligotrophos defluvii]
MSESIYDDLPEDPELAFVALEAHYKKQLESDIEASDEGSAIGYYKRRYCNHVLAASISLDIPHIKDYTLPANDQGSWDFYNTFETDVTNLIIQIKIKHARRRKSYSVAFDSTAKQKIRHYIEQIRTAVEQSNLSQIKRDAIFKKLSELTLEIDRDRTRFEVVADAIRGVARLSGDVEREGAEPWWKWVKLIFGEIDNAKEKEPQSSLPEPEERKRLGSPRRQLPSPTRTHELDDEIPF